MMMILASPSKGDETHIWNEMRANQEEILKEKQSKHKSFGDYSKYNYEHDDGSMNGIMLKKLNIRQISHVV
jgi:hypothetical protein